MVVTSNSLTVHARVYLYLVVAPISVLVWLLVLLIARPHLEESLVYRGIDSIPYLAVVGTVVLVAIPLRYRHSPSLGKLVIVSVVSGLALAFGTFAGYMKLGFG